MWYGNKAGAALGLYEQARGPPIPPIVWHHASVIFIHAGWHRCGVLGTGAPGLTRAAPQDLLNNSLYTQGVRWGRRCCRHGGLPSLPSVAPRRCHLHPLEVESCVRIWARGLRVAWGLCPMDPQVSHGHSPMTCTAGEDTPQLDGEAGCGNEERGHSPEPVQTAFRPRPYRHACVEAVKYSGVGVKRWGMSLTRRGSSPAPFKRRAWLVGVGASAYAI